MIWNRNAECMNRDDLERLQSELLVRLVAYVYERVPFYRQGLTAAGIAPDSFRGLEDLTRLPFTRKSDLHDQYPFGLFAVPQKELIRLHASSGTTGKPTVVGYTRADLDLWAEVCARCLAMSGAEPGQVFQNAYGYGLFTGGLGMHQGGEKMGLTVIPVSGGNTARQILALQDFGSEILACTPSYALALADVLRETGVPRNSLRLRLCLLGAEPWTEGMRTEIEEKLRVDALNIYGLSEVIGPGVANECIEAKSGSHVFEDHFLVEVIDPLTATPLPDGQIGELVFTTLTKQALPLLRYRTGDLALILREPCKCGRNSARMSRVVGRTDDMLIIRGINVYPSQIEAALVGVTELSPHYRIIVSRPKHLDELEVHVEASSDWFTRVGPAAFDDHDHAERRDIEKRAQHRIHDILALNVQVTVTTPNTLPRSEGGKLNRVEDRRKAE